VVRVEDLQPPLKLGRDCVKSEEQGGRVPSPGDGDEKGLPAWEPRGTAQSLRDAANQRVKAGIATEFGHSR
jgi:hypothetical protein